VSDNTTSQNANKCYLNSNLGLQNSTTFEMVNTVHTCG